MPFSNPFRPSHILPVLLAICFAACVHAQSAPADGTRKLTFDGTLDEKRLELKDLGPSFPTDWTGYTHLVVEMRTSSPQRFGLWVYTGQGPRRMEIEPLGQNVWMRAAIPLVRVYRRTLCGA